MRVLLMICCISFVYGAPANDQQVQILRYENNVDEIGNYNFAFETSDGTKRKEKSEIVHAGDPEKENIIVRGEFEYVGPDGVTYRVTYIADENGFQPQGDHLPGQPQPQLPVKSVQSSPISPGVIASLLG